MTIVRERLEEREELLSLFATRATQTKGRLIPEEPCEIRTDLQRDRERIVQCIQAYKT